MKKLYQKLIQFYTNSTIMLLLDGAIFYSARTKSRDVLQLIITPIDATQQRVEQKMMKGYKMQRNVTIVNEDSIISHISRLQDCVY